MCEKPAKETIAAGETHLYDYWKVLVKRKKIFLSIFFIPLILVIIISLLMPRYYRGEFEITNILLSATDVASLMGNMDDAQKLKIFANNFAVIKGVTISIPKKSTNKVNIIIESKTADVIPQASQDIFNYFNSLPQNQEKIARMMEDIDIKLVQIEEMKKANLMFLNQITDIIKKRQSVNIQINPADLIKRDYDLSIEVDELKRGKKEMIKKIGLNIMAGKMSPLSIAKQPSSTKIKQIIIIICMLSFLTGIFVVFFLDYIQRMQAREKK